MIVKKYRVTGRGNLEHIRDITITDEQYNLAVFTDLPYEKSTHVYKVIQQDKEIAVLHSANAHLFD